MNLNLQSKKKKVLWIVSVVLISMAMPSTVFADELKTATLQMKESTYYVYPHQGKEHAFGPENTVYYAIHCDGNGQVVYGEIIRQADDFVLEKVYPDGRYTEFTPPSLTEEQKQAFMDKYDPAKAKEKILKKEKDIQKKIDKSYADLIDADLVKLIKGNNYIIYTYTKADKKVFDKFSGLFEGITSDNTVEKNYDFAVKDVRDKINIIVRSADIKIPLKISIVPYECKDFPEGIMQYTMTDKGQYELHILLFNNKLPIEEQFNIQFEKYLQEVKK